MTTVVGGRAGKTSELWLSQAGWGRGQLQLPPAPSSGSAGHQDHFHLFCPQALRKQLLTFT